MSDVLNPPERPEPDQDAAKDRIRQLEEKLCEAEQELEAATEIINEQEINIECLRIQLEASDLTIDEAAATRRKLEQRIADLEDELVDERCPVIVAAPATKDQPSPQEPGYPPGYRPSPLVESMISQFQFEEKEVLILCVDGPCTE